MPMQKGKTLVSRLLLCLSLVLMLLSPAAGAQTIREFAAQAADAHWRATGPYDERGWLDRFYAPRNYTPAWTPRSAAAALALLERAPEHGLDPHEYGTTELARLLHAGSAEAARLDVALSAAMLHFLADLRVGRVRSEYHTRLPDPRLGRFDPVERLRAALASNTLDAAVHAAQPPIQLYERVRKALAHYRELARQPLPALPRQPGAKLAPGEAYAGARALHERLVLLGDLAPDAHTSEGIYDERLADGVRRFQARHGLQDDGIIGSATLAALDVPLARRVRQLELTLERLRWLPDFPPGPLVAVNLPSYRLWAFGADRNATPLEMRVVVGTAVKTPTPLFIGQLRYVEFNPYWNVPRSITLKEILPKMARDPGYLERNDMEIVGAPAGMHPVEALRAGKARLRQRPGPKNALGAVKFAMPNPMDIYLHSTPARELFQRSRRDLSHGCIRVENPAALAQFVLAADPRWDADSVQEALLPGPMRRVDLKAPIPVVIFYATAVVDLEGGVRFAPDVYGRDPKLEQALAPHAGAQAGRLNQAAHAR